MNWLEAGGVEATSVLRGRAGGCVAEADLIFNSCPRPN